MDHMDGPQLADLGQRGSSCAGATAVVTSAVTPAMLHPCGLSYEKIVAHHPPIPEDEMVINGPEQPKGASKNLERMARAAIVRSNGAPRREDIGSKYPTGGQRSMAGRKQVLMQVTHAFIAAGAKFFKVP